MTSRSNKTTPLSVYQREMDARIGHKICLELSEVHIQGTVESKRGSDGRYNLSNKTIEVGVGGTFNTEVPSANVVNNIKLPLSTGMLERVWKRESSLRPVKILLLLRKITKKSEWIPPMRRERKKERIIRTAGLAVKTVITFLDS